MTPSQGAVMDVLQRLLVALGLRDRVPGTATPGTAAARPTPHVRGQASLAAGLRPAGVEYRGHAAGAGGGRV